MRLIAACVPYVGIALVASTALPQQPGTDWVEAPMVGVADAFEQAWIREPLRYALAISGIADPARGVQRGDARALAARLLARASTARSRRWSATCTRAARRPWW